MARWVSVLQKAASWLMVAWGVATGLLALSLVGARPFSGWEDGRELVRVVEYLVWGVAPLLGSIWALRHKNRAARLLLTAALITCIGIAVDSYLQWHTSRLARDGYFSWGDVATPALLSSLVLLVPALFWKMTNHFGWPPLVTMTFSKPIRILIWFLVAICVTPILTLGTLFCALSQPVISFSRCSETSPLTAQPTAPFANPYLPDQTMFTAHPYFLGHWKYVNETYPIWTFAVVDRHFWGLPLWNRKFIAVAAGPRDGDRFLFDGYRHQGILTRLFPLYIGRVCGHTGKLAEQEAQLRVLRDGPPTTGVRIIGTVKQVVTAQHSSFIKPLAGAKVVVDAPGGDITTTTDQFGVYDLKNLTAGHYAIRTEVPGLRRRMGDGCGDREVRDGRVWGCELILFPKD